MMADTEVALRPALGLLGLMQDLVTSPCTVQASLSTRRCPEKWMDHPWITLAVSQAYLTAFVSSSLLLHDCIFFLDSAHLVQSRLQGLHLVYVAVRTSAFRRTR